MTTTAPGSPALWKYDRQASKAGLGSSQTELSHVWRMSQLQNTQALIQSLVQSPFSETLPSSRDTAVGEESACNAGDPGSIPRLGRSPGEGNGNPLQSSCLENPMDRGAWGTSVHRVIRVGHDLATKSPAAGTQQWARKRTCWSLYGSRGGLQSAKLKQWQGECRMCVAGLASTQMGRQGGGSQTRASTVTARVYVGSPPIIIGF